MENTTEKTNNAFAEPSTYDLMLYVFGKVSLPQRVQIEAHLALNKFSQYFTEQLFAKKKNGKTLKDVWDEIYNIYYY